MKKNPFEVAGKHIVIVGLGRSGLGAARLARARGAIVTVTESGCDEELTRRALELGREGVKVELGGHSRKAFLDADLVVASPGVDPKGEAMRLAHLESAPVIGELEFAYRSCQAPIIAVTGTNGKSTTTALIGEMVERSGRRAVVAGNIGIAFSEVVGDLGNSDTVVLEVSSFQLELVEDFHPAVACILNVTPDHLGRYGGSLASYARGKERLLEKQGPADTAILNADDAVVREMARTARAGRLLWFSRQEEPEHGTFVMSGVIVARTGGSVEEIMPASELKLPGLHNLENALAASAAALAWGVGVGPIRDALRSFTGLPHRMEDVGEVGGVRFINDSKATNIGALERSLESLREPIVLIAGGRDKGALFDGLVPLVRERVREVFVIGEASEKIRTAFGHVVSVAKAGSLEEAVKLAYGTARPGDVVLLAPGCSSFDMFRDFEHRGEVFRCAVERLARGTHEKSA